MNQTLYADAAAIANQAIHSVKPDAAVKRAVRKMRFSGRLLVISVGKAAWQMAKAALECLEYPVYKGIVITKYGHVTEPLSGIECYEAGHPVPDENSFAAGKAVLELTQNLREEDTVLFLLSGGGSALFECPAIPKEELSYVTDYMLKAGMDIKEMNVIRKRLSLVKGGKFAKWCAPARIESVILSDIVGDPLDMIASGPCAPDSASCADAAAICRKYQIPLSKEACIALQEETPKALSNVNNHITGSVRQLCAAAAEAAKRQGYTPVLLGDAFTCEAKTLGNLLADKLLQSEPGKALAYIAGGETVVHVTGKGLGGRNQELALTAAGRIGGRQNMAVISVGSDGTDGPTDAAGGYADGDTVSDIRQKGLDIDALLADNDAYHGLKASGGLIFTGPTGTNVNDVAIALLRPERTGTS